jgi:ELWxxDGT repeat protein
VVLSAELLEDRLLLTGLPALSPKLLLDINPGVADSRAGGFTQVNNVAFFSADSGGTGRELWASNGTAAGTFLVQDINSGSVGSYPQNLTNVGGSLFFTADDGTLGRELWESNGTAAGTFLVKDINAGAVSAGPSSLTNVNGTLFFGANDGTHGFELWQSNGSAAGTQMVADINPGTGSNPNYLTNVNGTLFFQANDGTNGNELWASDGTAAGTHLVKDINPGSAGSYPYRLTNVNGTLFFAANDGTHPVELWESNGTAAGTFLVNPGAGAYPNNLTNVGGTLFFEAFDGTHGNELWESNGTAAGTFLVQDINPGAAASYPSSLTNVNGTLFFEANDGAHGNELWASNGTAAGTFMLKDINPGSGASTPKYLTNANGTLFFEANDGTHGKELWASNGTAAGTSLVADINPGAADSYPLSLANVNGALLFSAVDAAHGREPWILPLGSTSVSSSPNPSGLGEAVTFTATVSALDLVPTGTVDFKEGSTDLTPGGVGLVGGQATFSTRNLALGSHVITAYYSGDGTFPAGRADDAVNPQVVTTTNLLLDVNPGPSSSSPGSFTQVNTLTFFVADDGTHGPELWASDGSAAGTFLVDDINAGRSGSNPSQLTNLNGTLFFSADDGSHGPELWESNGTAAGTFLVKDIFPGTGGLGPRYLTNVNGTLFFRADDGSHGPELWESNGTAAGTFMVQDINPGAGSSFPSYLTNVNGTLFFQAADDTHAFELWESNGTAAGTFLVKDINPGGAPYHGSNPYDLTNVNGTLFFAAADGTHGIELWESNGTAAGTQMVADINPGGAAGDPRHLTNVNGTLFFSANDGAHGYELWESNGTAAGTFLVKDIGVGGSFVYSSNPEYLTNVNGTLFFSATRFIDGTELWESDGTSGGTQLVKDIYPGIGPSNIGLGSNPSGLTNVNGRLFFSAEDGTHGIELWESNGTAGGTQMVKDINSTNGAYPDAYSSSPQNLTNVNGNLLFSADDGVHGNEPWVVVSTATTTSVSSTPNPSVFSQRVTFTATVSVTPGLPPLTGRVHFMDGATDLTPGGVSLASGQATFSTTTLAAGSHTITAVYGGDSSFTGSQGAAPQVVTKANSATTLATVATTAVYGERVAFVAFVTAVSPATLTPGTVTFKEGTTVLAANVAVSGGHAGFNTAQLSVGSHTITALYNGDSNVKTSSASSTVMVSKAATTTTLTSSPNASVSGQMVVFRAIVRAVAPGTGIPGGTVDFKDGATDLTPGGVSLSLGEATFSTTTLAVGGHTITAIYSGGPRFNVSQVSDAAAPQVVNKGASHTVLTAFPDPAVFGQVVTFTVLVKPVVGNNTPAGTVTFLDGTTTLGTMTLDSAGRATFTTASLSRGNHAISANYGGDGNFLASAYTGFGQAVPKDATTTTVTASANPAVVGTTITFTATVQANAPGAGTPTGTVTFKDITTVLGTGTLNAGQATFSTSALTLGTHAITASYDGDTNVTASFSPNIAEAISASKQTAILRSLATESTGPMPIFPAPSRRAPDLTGQRLDDYFTQRVASRRLSQSENAPPRRLIKEPDWLGS